MTNQTVKKPIIISVVASSLLSCTQTDAPVASTSVPVVITMPDGSGYGSEDVSLIRLMAYDATGSLSNNQYLPDGKGSIFLLDGIYDFAAYNFGLVSVTVDDRKGLDSLTATVTTYDGLVTDMPAQWAYDGFKVVNSPDRLMYGCVRNRTVSKDTSLSMELTDATMYSNVILAGLTGAENISQVTVYVKGVYRTVSLSDGKLADNSGVMRLECAYYSQDNTIRAPFIRFGCDDIVDVVIIITDIGNNVMTIQQSVKGMASVVDNISIPVNINVEEPANTKDGMRPKIVNWDDTYTDINVN